MDFDATLTTTGRSAVIALQGSLDADSDDAFAEKVQQAAALDLNELVVDVSKLVALDAAGVRAFEYARQKMDDDVDVIIAKPCARVHETLLAADLDDSVAIRL